MLILIRIQEWKEDVLILYVPIGGYFSLWERKSGDIFVDDNSKENLENVQCVKNVIIECGK